MHPAAPENRTGAQTDPRIIPLLKTPEKLPSLRCYRPLDAGRQRLEHMVRETFRHSYGARPRRLPRDLLGFEAQGRLLGVAGLRPADEGRLFSEQYLDDPVEKLIATASNTGVRRDQVIEVGNLALSNTGEARWLIAAVTAYLHGAGFHWVLFTAVAPLYNAFQRMGLQPQRVAPADVRRLDDPDEDWGSYYAQSPQVCFGSIRAGQRHLQAVITARQSRLRVLWERAATAGMDYHSSRPCHLAQARR